jgi:hypothetical protein
MILRSAVSSFALMTVLMASSALGTPAQAQETRRLSPVTPWAVTKVAGKDNVVGYCAVARRFRANTILTFARNENDEASIAVDFQASRIKAGVNTSVNLDPGAGEARSYEVLPVSDKAFVARLGRDEKFFAALSETNNLRVSAADRDYEFDLSDIQAGQDKLNTCLASFSQQVASGMNDTEAAAGDVIGNLKTDVTKLRQENKRLSSIVQKSQNLKALNQPMAHDQVVLSELAAVKGKLENENEILKKQAPATGISAGNMGPLGDLQQQNRRLQNALFSMKLARADVDGVRNKITGMVKENASIRAAIDDSPRPAGWRESNAEIYTLREENKRLQDLLAERSETVSKNLLHKVATLESAQESTRRDNAAMAQEMQELKNQIAARDRRLLEMSAISTEVEALRTRNKELEQTLMSNAGNANAVSDLNARVKSLESENARLIQQIQTSTAGGDSAQKIAALTKENSELKAQIESMKRSVSDADMLRAELDKVRKENESLKAQLAAAKAQIAKSQDKMVENKTAVNQAQKNSNSAARVPDEITESPMQRIAPADELAGLPFNQSQDLSEAQKLEQDMRNDLKSGAIDPAITQTPPQKTENKIAQASTESRPKQEPPTPAPDLKKTDITKPGASSGRLFSMRDVVIKSGIADAASITSIPGTNEKAWRWKSGDVFGSMEQSLLPQASGYEAAIKGYLDKTRTRCPADFAVVPDESNKKNGIRYDTYEIACVGSGINSTAAILFTENNGSFASIAHETTSEKMLDALDLRDRLIKALDP